MKKDRYLNLDVEFLPSKKDTWWVGEKTYGITFSQKDHVKTRVEIVMKGYDRTKHYVQFYENDELKVSIRRNTRCNSCSFVVPLHPQ